MENLLEKIRDYDPEIIEGLRIIAQEKNITLEHLLSEFCRMVRYASVDWIHEGF